MCAGLPHPDGQAAHNPVPCTSRRLEAVVYPSATDRVSGTAKQADRHLLFILDRSNSACELGRARGKLDTLQPVFQLLECTLWVNKLWNRSFILSTQSEHIGGFAKWPDTHPGELKLCANVVLCYSSPVLTISSPLC